jgi:hypothetical protein
MEGIWRSGKLVTPPSNLPDRASKPTVRVGWKEKAQSKESPVASEFPHQPFTPPKEKTWPSVSPEPAKPVAFVENPANQVPTISQPSAGTPATVAQATNEQPAPVQPVENPVTTQPKAENPSATIKGTDDDTNVWEGNRMEAELQFVTYLVDGIDTIFHKQTKIPFTGKMRVLDANGNLLGELGVLNGQMHGEEIFFDPNGNLSGGQLWTNGKRVR